MQNQGLVALGVIAVVVVCGALILWAISAFLKSEPKPQQRSAHFPTGPRQADPQDQVLYEQINQLVAFFVAHMKHARYSGLKQTRPGWAPSMTMRELMPRATTLPREITISRTAWWGGPGGHSCVTPDGQWEYYGSCESHREGAWDEFDAWWVVSSKRFRQSVAKHDPYPFNLYLVLDAGTATLPHALSAMGDMMEHLLQRHNPGAVAEFQRLRGSNPGEAQGGRPLRHK